MATSTQTRIDATHDGYTLVTYLPSGESRIEHASSHTCSIWLGQIEIDEIMSDPSIMARSATDEDIDEAVR